MGKILAEIFKNERQIENKSALIIKFLVKLRNNSPEKTPVNPY
jgi:hypothetical protein